jgi:hypothetical protein
MKIRLLLISIAFWLVMPMSALYACDVCGGASAADMGGVLPQFQRNVVGLRLRHSNFLHTGSAASMSSDGLVKKDQFVAYDLWLRWYLHPRLQLLAVLPYQQHTRMATLGNQQISGLGDIQLSAMYKLMDSPASPEHPLRHLLLLGAAVKLPNGPYQQRDQARLLFPAAFQIGSGTYSYGWSALYSVRYQRWGIQTDFNYRQHTTNELEYRFGNQLFGGVSMFYWYDKGAVTLLPQMAWMVESMGKDVSFGAYKPATGGKASLLGLGIDAFYRNLYVSAQWRSPINQALPETMPRSGNRFQLSLGWLFMRSVQPTT